MSQNISIIAEQKECTVVAQYEAQVRDASSYQSEAALEKKLIEQLVAQGYEYPMIRDEKELVANLRVQLGKLNGYEFSNAEWKRFFEGNIANTILTMEDKTEMIQRKNTGISLELDNGEKKNIHLIDKVNIHNNRLQVINQYVPEGGTHANRYDVTILVNGLPLVHIELKKRSGSLREAFNQINRYQRESFWAGKALFEYIQVFVISNGTHTKYYSNTTRFAHEKEMDKQRGKQQVESHSFEFTSFWSDAKNNIIYDLEDFAQTFLCKHTLLNVLTKFCVFTVDKNLLVMRPYQIAATERILLRIETAINNRWQGSTRAGGYIWHTTGSGKTLTSFKTAQLASQLPEVKKVLFVVDRQDLDYQTMKEYDNFEKDCANSNTNWKVLHKQLSDANVKIIITTIQKLSILLKRRNNEKELPILSENVVFIFDECHRSQFGDMHKLIVKRFKKYMMFGFTGTPIFAVNANKQGGEYMTTAQVFGGELDEKGNHTKALHTYTIINAINDKNVLKFKVDYIRTIKMKENMVDEDIWGIAEKKALMNPARIAKNVAYILKNFDIKTKRGESYTMSRLQNVTEVIRKGRGTEEARHKVLTNGFNSILAVDSVPMAIAYYNEFKRQMAEPDAEQLSIATIFTFAANEETAEVPEFIEEDPEAVVQLDPTSKEFLEGAIRDYNAQFGTSYDTSGDKFQNYYKDISLRMKNKQIDLLIVVGMFLTGFDAKTLNTLWVDKQLRLHGLLQAYSRTNRILNAVKDCGNIVCFRNLEKATNDCFALFGDENAGGIILMRKFEDYYYGYDEENGGRIVHHLGYKEVVEQLVEKFPLSELGTIIEEEKKKQFIRLFGNYLKAYNLLTAFDEFNPDTEEDKNRIRILKEGERQDYISWYNSLYEEFRANGGKGGEKTDISDDLEFEIELVKQVQIDITYILTLVQMYHESNCQNKEVLLKIRQGIGASPDMRDKRELIERFIERLNPSAETDVFQDWDFYLKEQKEEELNAIITEENLKPEETREFMDRAFAEGYVEENGVEITKILPPMPLFGAGNKRAEKKRTVLDKLSAFLHKFLLFEYSPSSYKKVLKVEKPQAPTVRMYSFEQNEARMVADESEKNK
ncbi:MAG: type I restriction endonuclease subunit R [Bacteroidales bacterium]|nr:type I restriction endonuclease subunit R [Bacteroidales bacterium]